MLRLHPLEERIVLDAALLIELGDDRRGAEEGEADSDAQMDAVDEADTTNGGDAGVDPSTTAMAALRLLDFPSPQSVAEALPAPLMYTEGDGDQRVLEAEQLPVLAADQGHATWATVTLEGASVGDELVAPDPDANFDIRSDGAHQVTISASAALLADPDSSATEIEALLRNKVALINYTNSAQDPVEGVRSLHFTLGNDGYQASLSRFVSLTSANDAPVLAAGGASGLIFTEPADPGQRSPRLLFDPGAVSITDVDSALVGGASVWISDAPASAADPLGTHDRLLVELPADGSITARLSFTPVADRSLGELRLTLEGAATAETYVRVLESVRFDSLDTDPLQTSRTVRIDVADIDDDGVREDAVSRSIERRISIEPTNTAPTVILEDVLFSEQSDRLESVPLFPRLDLLDPDSDDLLARVVVTLDNPGRHPGDSINAYLAGNALFSVTRVAEGARDTYTIQPRLPAITASVGEFEAFLASWTYGNSSRANVDHSIDITVRAFDAQGAVGERTSILTIVAQPDAPISDALPRPGSPGALTVAEDGRLPLPAELFPFRDVDGDVLAGVTISVLPAHGSLLLDGVTVQAGQLIPAASLAKLVYAPAPDYHGPDGFGFKVWDNSGANGGPGLASADQQASITVTPVNDAPLSTDAAVTTVEDTPRVLGLSDFGAYFDVENTPLAAVQITALASDGVLQFNDAAAGQPADWVSVTLGQIVSETDLVAGKLRFVPDLNENGSPYAMVGFKVGDGEAFSASAYTLTVNVTPVNDAPLSTDDAVTTAEDTPRVLGLSDFGAYSDVEITPLAAVQITALASDGVLQFNDAAAGQPANWVSVTLGQIVSETDLVAGKLRFVPDLNENGSPYATVGFKVGDGTVFSASAYTLTVNVTPVNDAPLSTDDAVTTAEDTPRVLGLSDFGAYFDVENTPLAAVQITAPASDGVLQFNDAAAGQPANWVAVTLGQVVSATDLAAGKLRFVPDLNENGSPYATVGFKVGDGTEFSASAYTLTVNVTPVNDAPLSTDDAITTAEDTPRVLGLSDFGAYFDVENTPLAAVQITTPASDGVLQFNDAAAGQPANWVAVTLGQVVSATDLAAGKLRFVPDLNENGSPYATVGFKVGDGTVFSASAYTLAIDVTPVDDPVPAFAGFSSPDDELERAEPELTTTPPLAYTAPFGYDVIEYEILLEPFTYPETASGSDPERMLAVSESFETCTLHPLLGIGCRFVPAVAEGRYLIDSGRGGLAYATPEVPGVPPEALTHDGLLADVPGQQQASFNAAFADAFPHTLAESDFVGVEPGQVELPPGGVLIPAYPEPMRPSSGAGER